MHDFSNSSPTRQTHPEAWESLPAIHFADDPSLPRTRLLQTAIFLPLPPAQLFPFFADAQNLEAITPPWLKFAVVDAPSVDLRGGSVINYRLRIRGIPMRWQSRIDEWSPPHRFTDEQVRGPYRRWHHEHRLHEVEGGTLMLDRVSLASIGGSFVRHFLIEPDLRRIFSYRHKKARQLFGDLRECRRKDPRFEPLPKAALELPVEGRHLRPGVLRDQLDDRPTLLLFVRHFG